MTLNFYIGGYGHNHSYRFMLNNGELSISGYRGLPIPEHVKVVAIDGSKDWYLLVKFLKGCKWNRRYDSEICDGTQWELKVNGNGMNINSYGSNAYPDDFDELLVLLNRVTGFRLMK